jgi:hypothetical protein
MQGSFLQENYDYWQKGKSMGINKPIFIIGSGRSGTTVFYRFLSTHPEVCWLSNYSDRFVNFKPAPLIHKILDFPLLGNLAKKNIINASGPKFLIKPVEGGRSYHEYSGFKHNVKTAEDGFDPKLNNKFKELIRRHCKFTGKKRFISKQTANTQRIRLINEMFKNAYYIHVIRDGRAVANSFLKVEWWKELDIWWLGEKVSKWNKKGGESIELCALQWKKNVREILNNKNLFEDRYIEIKYEELAADTWGTMSKVIDFCELNKSNKFIKKLPKFLKNMNYKWKEDLNEKQKLILDNNLKKILRDLGYS